MKCGKCEKISADTFKFCPYCGAELKEAMKDVDKPAQKENTTLECFPEMHFYPASSDPLCRFLVKFGIKGGKVMENLRMRTHSFLVLDVSASMSEQNKYPLLMSSVQEMIAQLPPDNLVSIALFSNRGHSLFSGITAGKLNSSKTIAAIDSSKVKFGSGTYLGEGLKIAVEGIADIRKRYPDMVNRMYILTDGQIHDLPACLNYREKFADSDIEVHSFGFGEDFDFATLRSVTAGCCGGTVKVILSLVTLKDHFGHLGEVSRNVIGKDAVLELTFNPGILAADVFRYRPGNEHYGVKAFKGGRVFQSPIGSIEAGREYSYMFEIRLPLADGTVETPLGTVKVSGCLADGRFEVRKAITVSRTNDKRKLETVNKDVENIRLVLDALRCNDVKTQVAALRARKEIYLEQGRNLEAINLIDSAIRELEGNRNLNAFSEAERSALKGTSTQVFLR